jgi:hypothetical protein
VLFKSTFPKLGSAWASTKACCNKPDKKAAGAVKNP